MKQPFQVSVVGGHGKGLYAVMVRPTYSPSPSRKITPQEARGLADCLRGAADAVERKEIPNEDDSERLT